MFYYNTAVNPSPALPIFSKWRGRKRPPVIHALGPETGAIRFFFKMEREKETSGRLRARSGDRRDQGKNGEGERQVQRKKIEGNFSFYAIIAA